MHSTLLLLGLLSGSAWAASGEVKTAVVAVATKAPEASATKNAGAAASATSAAAAPVNGGSLTRLRFPWPYAGPNHVDTFTGGRGPQSGDNICGKVAGQYNASSLCITSHINDISDWCLWAPPQPNSTIADTEGEEVAWCTKPGFGTRSIPPGALSGVQFLKTPRYAIVAGYIDQTKVNIASGDFGGELDPHGADSRGNPIGSLMYSTAFSTNGSYSQIIEWTMYIGGNRFCSKICAPNSLNATSDCQHRYDRLGCDYVMPMNYAAIQGSYSSCNADVVLAPGVFIGADGITSTFTQPAESVAITSLPYTPTIPASSQCTTFTSAALFSALGSGAAVATPTGAASAAVTPAAAGASSAAASAQATVAKGAAMRGPGVGVASAILTLLALVAAAC